MKKLGTILFLLMTIMAGAQVSFKTIVPREPVVEGESFRVQYVAEDVVSMSHFMAPDFTSFRLVNGPEVYAGSVDGRMLKNTTYTLQALQPGHFMVPGAKAFINDRVYRSNDVLLKVISRGEAERRYLQNGDAGNNSPYWLRPGEDPYEKIRRNLFIKVQVNRKTCFPGEPVVATFKLYSRLQSRSDIVKNPGLYGFTVQDMIGLDDRVTTTEKINGDIFNVHTIRKVQLYPLQAGLFSIDPMEVKNKVEFSRSTVYRQTEQEISEGVPEGKDEDKRPGVEIFETSISTENIPITVKAIPEKNRPADYAGATGRFKTQVSVEKKELARNEEGYLVVTVSGRGNFTQLSAPVISWPPGIDGFEPVITEQLDKSLSPLEGTKTFRYAFVAAQAGSYTLPAFSFSFFDPDTNRFHVLNSKPVPVVVSAREKDRPVIGEKKISLHGINRRVSLVAAGVVVLAVLVMVVYWLRRSKKESVAAPVISKAPQPVISAEDILKPAYLLLPAADKDFYSVLQQSIWKFFSTRIDFSVTGHTTAALVAALRQRNAGEETISRITNWLQQCETVIYTGIVLDNDRKAMLEEVKAVLEAV